MDKKATTLTKIVHEPKIITNNKEVIAQGMNNIVNTVPREYFPQSDLIKMMDTMLNMKYTNRSTHIMKNRTGMGL